MGSVAGRGAGGRCWRGLAALLAVTAVAGCNSAGAPRTVADERAEPSSSAGALSAAPTSTAPPTPAPTGAPVRLSTFEADGRTYGVAMPIIVYFSTKITDASAFERTTTVTVNGQPAAGAWYFEPSQRSRAGLEAHYRLPDYWPAHAVIQVDMPLKGKSAGTGLVFAEDLALRINTGAAQIARADGRTERMTITSDGKPVKTLKVSLGKPATPTLLGTAVVMAKSNPEEMKSDPGEKPAYDIKVPWSVRVTNDGEFIHDASWNGSIGSANLSHGCTNLQPADARWYYAFAQIGDPVTWTHTGTTKPIPVGDGWGDWNLDWATWSHGGSLPPPP
jgi:lipoprotein-anchoring transpeptidase ErfK/SrfK